MEIVRKIKVFYKDKLASWLINFSALFFAATWTFLLFSKIKKDPLAVLHYNIYAGLDVLGDFKWLYFIPLIVLIISLLDILLASLIFSKNRLSSYFLLTAVLFINAVILFYINYILKLN